MPRLALLFVLPVLSLPAFASSRITVADLERKLAADRGRPDAEMAQRLSDCELTERLSPNSLKRLKSNSPGAKTSQQLIILADESEFLPLPLAEIPATPAPDVATQRQIMGLVVSYVSKTIHQLPNFSATRVTTHFEETPQVQTEGHASRYLALHETGSFKATVLYRDGQEIVDAGKVNSKESKKQARGLREWGEFGPILSTVFLDAARSDLRWSHWEKIGTNTLAVFQYAVAPGKSHYRVNYCCVPGTESDLMIPFDRIAGYHGEIAVDPQQGSIMRLTVQADLKPTDPVSVANIMVEYAPVEIGGKTYICATRSVASSKALSISNLNGDVVDIQVPGPPQKLLNVIAFEDYHLFRSDVRILTDEEANQQEHESAPSPSTGASEATSPSSTTAVDNPAPSTASSRPAATAESAAIESAISQPSEPPSAPAKPVPAAANPPSAIDSMPVFRTTSREVVVDVVVTKGNGEPVHGLARQDFEISENGKPQSIDFFDEHTQSLAATRAPTEMPPIPPGMQTNVPPAPPGDAVNVLLIDTLNTATQDQAYVRREIIDFLSKMQPGSRIAIFALGSKLRCLQGFTSDTSALLAAIHDPRTGLRGEKSTFLKTNGDRANDAADLAKLQTMQTSPAAIEALRAALEDAGAHDFDARSSMTFEALIYLGHYLAGIPGRKNLIWFAGSFPLVIFPTADQFERMEQNPKLPGFVDRVKTAADLFTVSQVAVYPISAEGLMTEHVGEADLSGPGSLSGAGHVGSQAADSAISPFNAAASERATTTSAMERLASSTGGKAYYNSNDLNSALRHAIDDGSNYYTIAYAPADMKMDGSFRQVEVKLAHGKFKLSYRHGYNADDAATSSAKSSVDPLVPLLHLNLPDATGVLYGVSASPSEMQPAAGAPHVGQNPNLKYPVTRYTVDFVIRSQDLGLKMSAEGGRSGKLLLGLKAYDGEGNALNWQADVETLEIKPGDYDAVRKNGIPAHLNIDLPSTADIHLVTAVYDMSSGKAGTQEIRLQSNGKAHSTQTK